MELTKSIKLTSHSPKETEDLAYTIGLNLGEKAILCLDGDLGVGKTAFAKGLALALDIKEHITSPTFTIINQYEGKVPLYHFDVYRIYDVEEMLDIGFEEYIYSKQGICIIEWSNRIKEILPDQYLKIHINKDLKKNINYREIKIESIGDKYNKIINNLQKSNFYQRSTNK